MICRGYSTASNCSLIVPITRVMGYKYIAVFNGLSRTDVNLYKLPPASARGNLSRTFTRHCYQSAAEIEMTMQNQIKIIIADDYSIVRQGLRQMLDADEKFTVIGEAKNGREALDLIAAHQPDVTVLDVDMPEMGGFELVRELRGARKIEIEIVFLTMHSEEEIFQTALDLSVGGCVLKDDATTDIVAAVKAVAAGKSFISPSLFSLLLNRRRRAEDLKSGKPELSRLTPTERRVLQLIAEDKTSREIGDELFVSHRAVDTHRLNISRKLNLRANLAR